MKSKLKKLVLTCLAMPMLVQSALSLTDAEIEAMPEPGYYEIGKTKSGPCFEINWMDDASIKRCQVVIENTLKYRGQSNEEYCENIYWEDEFACIPPNQIVTDRFCESLIYPPAKATCFKRLKEQNDIVAENNWLSALLAVLLGLFVAGGRGFWSWVVVG